MELDSQMYALCIFIIQLLYMYTWNAIMYYILTCTGTQDRKRSAVDQRFSIYGPPKHPRCPPNNAGKTYKSKCVHVRYGVFYFLILTVYYYFSKGSSISKGWNRCFGRSSLFIFVLGTSSKGHRHQSTFFHDLFKLYFIHRLLCSKKIQVP